MRVSMHTDEASGLITIYQGSKPVYDFLERSYSYQIRCIETSTVIFETSFFVEGLRMMISLYESRSLSV